MSARSMRWSRLSWLLPQTSSVLVGWSVRQTTVAPVAVRFCTAGPPVITGAACVSGVGVGCPGAGVGVAVGGSGGLVVAKLLMVDTRLGPPPSTAALTR